MSEFNYQRMLEEQLEAYERVLAASPDEQAQLEKRIAFKRRFHRMSTRLKTIVKNCSSAGSDHLPASAIAESLAMDSYLDDVQEEIFMRVAKAERAMELDTAAMLSCAAHSTSTEREKPQPKLGLSR